MRKIKAFNLNKKVELELTKELKFCPSRKY